MKKRYGIVGVLIVCLAFVSYVYLKQDDQPKETQQDVYLKTVVFKDRDNDLIPITVNFHSEMELETDIRNKIDLMKSTQMQDYGLYPVFDSQLEVQSVDLKDGVLKVSFNDCLYSNQDALNMIEALTYTLTDYQDVKKLQLQIDGEDVSYLPNSSIPLSSLTHDLGLNNFEEASTFLHESIPVMIYQEKMISQYLYYVPTTLRINEKDSLKQQVQTVLSYIDGKIQLLDAYQKDNVLTIELDSNILLDNETIDQTLEDLIVLSLTSLKNVDDVEILIDHENVRSKETSQIEYNYIKI